MEATHPRKDSQVQLRYRKLVENLPGCIVFVLDREMRVTFAGGGLVAHVGPRPQAYLGCRVAEFMSPSAHAYAEPYLLATLAGEETSFALDYPTGTSLEVRTSPLQEGNGPTTEILVVALDTTQRKRAEIAERKAKWILQQAVQATNIGLWDYDLLTGRVHYSREWKQQLGCEDDEISADFGAWDSRLHPDDQERVRRVIDAYLAAPWPNYEEEFRLRHKDGSYRWILARGTIYYDASGKPAHVLGVHIDITERKLREVEREQMCEQLQRQERMAAVGQLAAGIAHDFNNIMSVISVYAELIGGTAGLGDKDRARTETIVEHAQRATRMIRQILDFSRQAVYERQMLDLLPLLKEESRLLRQTLPESIEFKLDYAPGEYFVLADPTRIQQLVMNLALNARDAMPEGGTLHVVLGCMAVAAGQDAPITGMAAGEWVQIAVSDTGTGIRAEHLEHIFEPFFTTKEPGRGTGLGLAQVQGIVAQHEGHIAVASELGAGTIFAVYLPAAVMQVPTTLPTRGSFKEDVTAHAMPPGQGERVLLVEDDGGVRSAASELLKEWNYRVVQAANGHEALVCLERARQQVDVILSDVVMPRLGGIGLVKALRQDGVETPVILMSGYGAGETRVGLRDAGVVAWLDKPLSSEALAEALAEAMAVVRG